MFREKFLIKLDAGQAKVLLNPLSTPEARTNILNSNEEAGSYNDERREKAAEELQHPIKDTIKGIREMLSRALSIIPNGVGAAANLGKWVVDLARVIPRTVLIATDYVGEKTFGTISRLAKKTEAKIKDTVENFGTGNGGQSSPTAAAHGGH